MVNCNIKKDTIIVFHGGYIYLYSLRLKKAAKVKINNYSEKLLQQLGFFNDITPLEEEVKRDVGPLFLLLRRDCPLGCLYCYANANLKQESMSIETAEKAVKAYLDLKPRFPNVRFGGGGEPTLSKKLIMHIIDVFSDVGIKWSMITSGIMDENFLHWLINKHVNITFSLDGPPEIQDIQRCLKSGRSSSQIVERNCLTYRKKKGKLHVRCTLTKISLKNLDKLLRYFKEIGVTLLNIEPMYPMGRGEYNRELVLSADETVDVLLKVFEWGRQSKIVIRNVSLYHPSFFTDLTYCGPINGTALVVNHQGHLVACGEALDASHPFWSMWCIGKLEDNHFDIDIDKRIKIMNNSNVDSMKACKDCFAKYICRGGCPMRRLFQTGQLNLPDQYHCFVTQMLVKALIIRMVEGKYPSLEEIR